MEQAVQPIRKVLNNVLSMHTATNLTTANKQEDFTQRELTHSTRSQNHNQSNTLISTLWGQLTDIYGARFLNAHGEKDLGVWQIALSDLQEEEIRQGLYLMMRDKRFETWPPNCTEFRHLCLNGRKEDSLPTVHQAFNEARQNALYAHPVWSHKAVKFTVKYVGVDIVNSAYTHHAFEQFKKAYAKVCARIQEGHEVPEITDEEVAFYHRKQQKLTNTKNNITTLRRVIHAKDSNDANV